MVCSVSFTFSHVFVLCLRCAAKRKDKLVSAAAENSDILAPIKQKHADGAASAANGGGSSVGADSNIFYDMLSIYSGVQRVAAESDTTGGGGNGGGGSAGTGNGHNSDDEGGSGLTPDLSSVHPYYQYYAAHTSHSTPAGSGSTSSSASSSNSRSRQSAVQLCGE